MATKSTSKPTGTKTPQKTAIPKNEMGLKTTVNWLNQDENASVRASVSITIGDAFAVHGIKVIRGNKGEFVSMPSYKKGEEYKDIFHAVTADARQQINDAVLSTYEQKLAEQNQDEEEISTEELDKEDGQVMDSM